MAVATGDVRAWALRGAVAAATLIAASGALLRVAQLRMVEVARGDAASLAAATRLDGWAAGLAYAELASMALCALLFARWTAELFDVAAAAGARLSAEARRGAVWSWLVPGAQLWRPRAALTLLVEQSRLARGALPRRPDEASGYRDVPRHEPPAGQDLIARWWSVWLASRVVEALATALGDGESDAGTAARLALDLGADVLLVVAGVLAYVVIGRVEQEVCAR